MSTVCNNSNSRMITSSDGNAQPRCFQELIDMIVSVPQDFTARFQETQQLHFQHSLQNDESINELAHADESISQLKVIAMYLANKVVEIRSKHNEEIEFLESEIAASKDEDAVYKQKLQDYYGVYQEMEERHQLSQKLNAELEEKCDQYLYKITTLYQAMESAQHQNKHQNSINSCKSENATYMKDDLHSILLQSQQQQPQEHALDSQDNQGDTNRNECSKCLASNWEIERLNKELAGSKEVIETLRKRLSQMFIRKKKPMKEKIKEQMIQGMMQGNNPRKDRKNTVQLESNDNVEFFQQLEQKQQLRQRLEEQKGEALIGKKQKKNKKDNQLLRESVLDSLMKVTMTAAEGETYHRKEIEEEDNYNIMGNNIIQQSKEVFMTENDVSPDEMEQEGDRVFMTEGDATWSNDNNNHNGYDLVNGANTIADRRRSFASYQENNYSISNSSQHLKKSQFQVDSEEQMKKSRETAGGNSDLFSQQVSDQLIEEKGSQQQQLQMQQKQQQQQMQYLQLPQLQQRHKQQHRPSLQQFNLAEAQLQLEQTSILNFQHSNVRFPEMKDIVYPPIVVVPATTIALPEEDCPQASKPLNTNTNSIVITNTNSNTIATVPSSQSSLPSNNPSLPAVPSFNCTQPQLKSLFEELDEFTRQSLRILTPQRSRSNSQNKAVNALFSLSSSYKALQGGGGASNNNILNNNNNNKDIAQLYQQPEKDEIIEKKPTIIPPFSGQSENSTPKMGMLQFKKMVPSQLNQTSPLQDDQQESLDRLFKKIDKEDHSGLKTNSMSCIVRDFNRKSENAKLQNTRQTVTCFISPHASQTPMTTSATNNFNEKVLQRLLQGQQAGKTSQSSETTVQKLQIGEHMQLLNRNDSKIVKNEVLKQSQIMKKEQQNGQNNSQADKEEEEEKNWVPEDNNSKDNTDYNLSLCLSRERMAIAKKELVSQLDFVPEQRVLPSQENYHMTQQNQQEEQSQSRTCQCNCENKKEMQVISKINQQQQVQQLKSISMTFTQWIILLILFPVMSLFNSIFKRR